MRHTSIHINQSAFADNLERVKQLAPQSQILAMVKANAYGHGIDSLFPVFCKADALGVACLEEAKQLRNLGWQKPVVIIEGAFSQAEWLESLNLDCQNVIHHCSQVTWALQHPPKAHASSQTLWLKMNTGMNRLGFDSQEIPKVAKQLHNAGYALILTSHFANADVVNHPLNAVQINTFIKAYQRLKQDVSATIKASLCNSAALFNFPHCHLDWVRPGIMLYGSSPLNDQSAAQLNLSAVMRFSAAVMAIHDIPAGTPVGYGSIYVTPTPTRKGIVSIGYGDGYPRVIDSTAYVTVVTEQRIVKCPIIGRVAMDMIAIDLSQVPEADIGTEVILWGEVEKQEPSIDEIAKSANTIGYELLCRVTARPARLIN